ncbi:MAG: diacylglycerol kinase [Gammaproteobacteria bacterium]|nr:diacylglycerol kinase [Gammaproteobacteria bacterium]
MAYSGNKGLKRLILATGYSWQGFKAGWKHEEAFRQEVVLAIILIPLALFLNAGSVQTALMIGSVILVLIVEILNSAVEAVVDLVTTEKHELAGRAKDMGSTAVMLALINVAVVWAVILYALYFK